MTFALVGYDELSSRIRQSIRELLKHHKFDPTNLEGSLAKLPEDRRKQSILLLKVLSLLDQFNPKKTMEKKFKERVLNAVAYFVRENIEASYGYISPERSNLFCSLTTALAITKENTPSESDLAGMYRALQKFFYTHTYKDAAPEKGYLDTPQFDSVEDIVTLANKIHECQLAAVHAAKSKYMEDKKHIKPSSGILGGFSLFGSSLANAPKAEEEAKANSLIIQTIT